MNALRCFCAAATLFVASISIMPATASEHEPSLYQRMGGIYAIATVVDEFIDRLLTNDTLNANPAIDAARKRVPAAGLKHRVTAFVAQATGGPQTYTGHSMKKAHAHLNITEREWRAMVAELDAVLYSFNVPDAERKELLRLVGTLKDKVISEQ